MDAAENLGRLSLEDGARSLEEPVLTDFHKLPPEMVTSILERLDGYPDSILESRLVCRQFKSLTDDILEKKQWSLWNWNMNYGEGLPTVTVGPIQRPVPTGKLFQNSRDMDKFILAMRMHLEVGVNPFPNRGMYIRRIRRNPPFPPKTNELGDASSSAEFPENQTLHEIRMRSLSFFERQLESRGIEESDIISVFKMVSFLDMFGGYLSSLILECGITADLDSVQDLAASLDKVPNLQYLMLKGVRVRVDLQHKLEFPPLPQLKSLKIIQCSGITGALLSNYHNQLVTLQMLNHSDYWFPHVERLQKENSGTIFGKLRNLKIGVFENPSEFDYFTTFLQSQQEKKQPLRVERLAIHYNITHEFTNSTEKLFQILKCIPTLKEFNAGNSASTNFEIGIQEERSNFSIGDHKAVTKLTLPVSFIRHSGLVRKIFGSFRRLRRVRFLDCDRLLWSADFHNPLKVDIALGLPPNVKLHLALQELMLQFPSIQYISVDTSFGEEERKLCVVCKNRDEPPSFFWQIGGPCGFMR